MQKPKNVVGFAQRPLGVVQDRRPEPASAPKGAAKPAVEDDNDGLLTDEQIAALWAAAPAAVQAAFSIHEPVEDK